MPFLADFFTYSVNFSTYKIPKLFRNTMMMANGTTKRRKKMKSLRSQRLMPLSAWKTPFCPSLGRHQPTKSDIPKAPKGIITHEVHSSKTLKIGSQ